MTISSTGPTSCRRPVPGGRCGRGEAARSGRRLHVGPPGVLRRVAWPTWGRPPSGAGYYTQVSTPSRPTWWAWWRPRWLTSWPREGQPGRAAGLQAGAMSETYTNPAGSAAALGAGP